jgi:hypothetical protein
MAIVFTNSPIFTTTITGHEIMISPIGGSGSTIATTSVDRLGYTSSFGSTALWQNPIWFRFYEPTANAQVSFGTLRTFQTTDIETKFGASITADDINKMLSMLFLNYYNSPSGLKSDIETAVPLITNIFERLNGVTPTNPWETIAPTVSTSPGSAIKAVALFQDFGLGFNPSYAINYSGDTSMGIVYKEVHMTGIDPLADSTLYPAKYRYLAATQQQIYSTPGNQKVGMVVYTNLFDDAFAGPGMLQYFQFMAIWPIIARILQQIQNFGTAYAPVAYINSMMDATVLQKGSGYFNRASRVDTTKGWFGNPIFSFSNSFRLAGGSTATNNTIFAPFIGYSEYLCMKNFEYTYGNAQALPFANNIPCIWAGNDPNGNLAQSNPKAYVRLIMYYTACVQRVGSTTTKNNVVLPTEANIVALHGLPNIAAYYQGCADQLAVGDYAYFFRFAQTVAYDGSTIFDTFIAPYIPTWASSISSVVLLALDKYSANTATTLMPSISNLVSYYSTSPGGPYHTAMSAGEETALTTYTYP